ncbi:arginine N-succinyltransferase [Endozoicomonas sp. (ex Bugula neritina AB1)]|nr:arginine N-succinyltransferase [Endozoicomonas sp. (ex Bugula neritina AB1)]
MMIVRPITTEDHDALWELAQETGVGFSSLQPDRKLVANKLQWALKSQGLQTDDTSQAEENLFLFVMEDTETNTVVGVAALESAVGLSAPWYSYKVNKQVHASRKLNVYTMAETLMLCSDHTGYSELCTLFLKPEARHSRNGALLSKSRFLFMAAFPELFNDTVLAEMRGYSDKNEVSPFWEALGRHFFAVDFVEADRQVSADKAVIAELMPRHPIYVNLLPEDAQKAIAATHESTTPARHLLENEGLHYTGYVDIFDAGPLLEAKVSDIRAVRDSRLYQVKIIENPTTDESLWLLANNRFKDFRCTVGNVSFESLEFVLVSSELAKALGVSNNDELRVVRLSSSNGKNARNG